MTPRPTADEKLAHVCRMLDAGHTVRIGTAFRVLLIKPATWRKWAASGRPLARVRNGSLEIIERGRYVCADYCWITAGK